MGGIKVEGGGGGHCRLNPSSLLISPLISFPHRSRTNLSLQRFYSEEGQRRVNTRDLGVYSSALWTELLMTHHCSQISADRPLSSRDLFNNCFLNSQRSGGKTVALRGSQGCDAGRTSCSVFPMLLMMSSCGRNTTCTLTPQINNVCQQLASTEAARMSVERKIACISPICS